MMMYIRITMYYVIFCGLLLSAVRCKLLYREQQHASTECVPPAPTISPSVPLLPVLLCEALDLSTRVLPVPSLPTVSA